MRQQDQGPNHGGQQQRGQYGGGAYVLGAPGEFMALETDAVNHHFDAADDVKQTTH